jgi:hypothetical protein
MADEVPNAVIFAVSGLGRAYSGACSDLGLGHNGQDISQRERLANILVRLFQSGERDTDALQRRAVLYVRNSGQPLQGS